MLQHNVIGVPLNRLRILAISLLILFSSSSLTRAPRMSAMNWTHYIQTSSSVCIFHDLGAPASGLAYS